jgi:RNA polymerase sigma-B factor
VTSRNRTLAPADRESLIESHLPLAKSVARRYVGRGVELDDLVQVGAVGLVKAANRFDPRRGVSFRAFAEPTIEGEIRHHLRDRSGPVRIPRELQRLGKRLRGRQSELAASLGRAPTLSELADAVDADTGQVERALAAERARESVSLPAPEDGAEAVLTPEPYADSDDRLLLTERMHVLDERERQIVYLRFHGDMTERQIAREVGISQAHVSRLLAGALTKLRAELAEDETATASSDTTAQSVVSRAAAAPSKPESVPVKAGKAGPKAAAAYSGRFLVRMSGDLHQQLAQAAEREQVSLNRFVTDALAESVTGEHEPVAAPSTAPAPVAAGRSEPEPPVAHSAVPDTPAGDESPAGRPRNPRLTLRMVLAANLVVVVLAGTIAIVLLVLALQQGL